MAFFRERLRKANLIDEFFEMFESYLSDQGLEARGGQIIDATLVPVPKERNNREDNKEIKANRLPDGWIESPKLLQQKDLGARWVKKMVSITMVIITAFALMLSTVLSVALYLPLQIFTMV